jgi:cyclic pyranopterin phosphate synthase
MNLKDTHMIDITDKKKTVRMAVAGIRVNLAEKTLTLIKNNQVPKGDVFAVSQTAAILAAKKTPDLLPLCHPLLLTGVSVDFNFTSGNSIDITVTIKGKGQTGFEMEALTAAAVAALTIYDMCKMIDRKITITDLRLLRKTGGKSGDYIAER